MRAGEKRKGELDDFADAERPVQEGFATWRTTVFGRLVRPLAKFGLKADHLTLAGLLLLIPYAVGFDRWPLLAFGSLVLAVLMDGLDGVFARVTGTADDAGAFTDVCADQVGLVVTVLLVLHHGLAQPALGGLYAVLYVVVVAFSVLQNFAGVPLQLVIRTKYPLYILASIWMFTGWEAFDLFFGAASVVMLVNAWQSFSRLRRSFRGPGAGEK